jgi:condensin complex subunit 2
VNVKKLKTDVWAELEKDCSSEATENISTTTPPKEVSFQDVVCDIAQDQTQKDASFSFYFICLLHLANEKVIASTVEHVCVYFVLNIY